WSPQANRNYADFAKRAGKLGGRMALEGLNHFKTAGVNWSTAPAAPTTAPAPLDLATLPENSPVDLGIPATVFNGGEYLTMKNLPANSWLLATVHGTVAPAPAARIQALAATENTGSSVWVRSNAAGEAPLSVPADAAPGDFTVTVQDAEGILIGFAGIKIAEEVPETTPPATTEPSDDTTPPATTKPSDDTTPPASTKPATTPAADSTTSAAPTQGSVPTTAPSNGNGTDDLANTGTTSSLLIGGALLALIAGLLTLAVSRRRSSMH
ncbi:MAG: hypothetical protein Q4P21_15675, partial [Arthrobacter sp.]|nr:hypothetical protein [Arthrobacter sp.]